MKPNVTLHPENIKKLRYAGNAVRMMQYLERRNNLFIIARRIKGEIDVLCSVFVETDFTEVANKASIKSLYRKGAISFPIIDFEVNE